MNKSKTIFCDIDGTLCEYPYTTEMGSYDFDNKVMKPLPGTLRKLWDWEKYCDITGTNCVKLGHHAKSEHEPYREYYNEELMTTVALIYENDFKEFKYRRNFNVKL